MELDFGTNAIEDYFNVDGNATKTTARKTEAIALAGDIIDSVLRMSPYQYRLPIADSSAATPKIIKHIASVLATVWGYDTTGARDKDQSGHPVHMLESRRTWALDMLERIRTGIIKLDAVC